ncbi:CopM family metallochaperone [Rodentibacter trehalosifermentans]
MANTAHHHHSTHLTPMQQELMAGMNEMHQDMMKGMESQDADIAFAAGMIPHHQGAVKMAEIELKYGKDPELRQLAENIIKAQEEEIKFMQQWLKKHQK